MNELTQHNLPFRFVSTRLVSMALAMSVKEREWRAESEIYDVTRSGLQNHFPLGVRWDVTEVALTRTGDELCACLDEKGKVKNCKPIISCALTTCITAKVSKTVV